jgi:hypothetical protein
METGNAFCAENTATTTMISNARINTLILPLHILMPFFMIIPQKLNLWKTSHVTSYMGALLFHCMTLLPAMRSCRIVLEKRYRSLFMYLTHSPVLISLRVAGLPASD